MSWIVKVRKHNEEYLATDTAFTFRWLASLEGAKWLRLGWEVKLEEKHNVEA